MINVIDLIKHLFVSAVAVISILNPFVAKPTPTPVPISIETPTETPSPTPTIPTQTTKTYVPLPTNDPDPVVSCNISANCGGGTTSLKRSECSNSTCCQIGNKWIFYKDKNQCTKDQNASSSNNGYIPSNYTYPTYAPLPTYNPNPLITCVVNYPCTGNSYTYQVDQYTCNFMQSGAASTCSTADAIRKMQDIVNQPIALPKITPVDYSIHFEPTPTPLTAPYGYGYSK